MPTTQRTFRVDDDLWEAVKELATKESKTVTEIITELLSARINGESSMAPLPSNQKDVGNISIDSFVLKNVESQLDGRTVSELTQEMLMFWYVDKLKEKSAQQRHHSSSTVNVPRYNYIPGGPNNNPRTHSFYSASNSAVPSLSHTPHNKINPENHRIDIPALSFHQLNTTLPAHKVGWDLFKNYVASYGWTLSEKYSNGSDYPADCLFTCLINNVVYFIHYELSDVLLRLTIKRPEGEWRGEDDYYYTQINHGHTEASSLDLKWNPSGS